MILFTFRYARSGGFCASLSADNEDEAWTKFARKMPSPFDKSKYTCEAA
jgi:hypothetical protein